MNQWKPSLTAFASEGRLAELKQAILDNLYYAQGRIPELATTNDWYMAVAYVVRDRMMNDWIQAFGRARGTRVRIVSYLSAEFLIGPQLGNNLLCVYEIRDPIDEALKELGQSLDKLLAHEPEPGLGNGGLGRLAACYMDSLTTLNIPAIGYGIRYEFGLFDQEIQNGWQVEKTDKWLTSATPGRCRGRRSRTTSAPAATPSNITTSTATSACAGFPTTW